MKKLLLVLILGFVSFGADSGEDIYKAKCASCHAMKGMMDQTQMQAMRQKMQNATQEEKMAMREKMMLKMQKSKMKAPPMPMVSKRLKMMLKTREDFIAFVADYIQNPSIKKGFCMPMAYKRFGTMPPIGKTLSKEERTVVASWLYDNFKESWGKSMGGKMCEMKNKNMKCGAGKCGAVKIQTH
ncbi:c-type cytochrome [Sulfurimonas sediminis]|uniref:C-type cytochrome n=1 Tax=Sulfurimonas sediminis TaxID=2590020 RepID=A0A7M1AYC4_9BACT|nr:c-type cytochrome [Sulfurimonas sediminis]QOP42444.1 c-type cytochrome [Sulfurimonas sediminis]